MKLLFAFLWLALVAALALAGADIKSPLIQFGAGLLTGWIAWSRD
jgi:hypothetical protein